MKFQNKNISPLLSALIAALSINVANADQVITDDLIVIGSNCVGQDCVNGENFGFDTLRLKENNLRIKAQDTSSSGGFPSNDWQITFNDSANGGQNKFSIDDIDGGKTPFTIEAGTKTNALYLDSTGKIGVGTNTPVVDIHIKQGNTPAMRLEQDSSSGFTAQTWDVAGNEANFFVRDATHGSKIPFKIVPDAPTNSLYVASSGNIGVGTASPDSPLHVLSTATTLLNLQNTNGTTAARALLSMTNASAGTWSFTIDTAGQLALSKLGNGVFDFRIGGDGSLQVAKPGTTTNNMKLDSSGNLTIAGSLITGTTTYPDYVFDDNYKLMSLDDVKSFINKNGHLPNIPSAKEMIKNGVNLTEMHIKLMEKVEELTLYSVEQHEEIAKLKEQLAQISQPKK